MAVPPSLVSQAPPTSIPIPVWSSGWTVSLSLCPCSFQSQSLSSGQNLERSTVGGLALTLILPLDSPVGRVGLRASGWLRDLRMSQVLCCLVTWKASPLLVDLSICSSQYCYGMEGGGILIPKQLLGTRPGTKWGKLRLLLSYFF